MEQNKEFRYRSTQIWSSDFLQQCKDNSIEKGYPARNSESNWTSIHKEINLNVYLKTYMEINSKWIIDLNVKLNF